MISFSLASICFLASASLFTHNFSRSFWNTLISSYGKIFSNFFTVYIISCLISLSPNLKSSLHPLIYLSAASIVSFFVVPSLTLISLPSRVQFISNSDLLSALITSSFTFSSKTLMSRLLLPLTIV